MPNTPDDKKFNRQFISVYDGPRQISGIHNEQLFANFQNIEFWYKHPHNITLSHADPRDFLYPIKGNVTFMTLDPERVIDIPLNASLPEFNILIQVQNEEGKIAHMMITGVKLKYDYYRDLYDPCLIDLCKDKYLFCARKIIPWTLGEYTKPRENENMIINPFTGRKSWL